ncbi:MAG: type II/IV secretion system ATPase subunit [Candidatus Aenigmarchaeota archaeon]|nr:type II/IV secretion system ATPase subunit [Candidatus Aenigmarchaeota archaeon]
MEVIGSYTVIAENVPGEVTIIKKPNEYTPIYDVKFPTIEPATQAVLDSIKDRLVEVVNVKISEILDPKANEGIKERFIDSAREAISRELPALTDNQKNILAGHLVHEMLGLGRIEVLLRDANLEELVINNSSETVWVFHKELGWLKTNLSVPTEEQIYNYSSLIGRKVGRQITNLNPLMDAHLTTGDRVNSTLFPISTKGNTITIRKFRREPWTIIHFIDPKNKTISPEVAALLWLCMQYELNILVAGGTASGKTSILNALMAFLPPNQRLISIEDTRELRLPDFLHWVPLTTREANPEGKGEVSMLDLLVNSLRMRPDRIVVGEIRRQREAEVLFEAMHTGHSVYATLHADRAEQVVRRLTNPPINLPESLLESLHLVIVQYRHRKYGIRRTLEVAEFIPGESGKTIFSSRLELLYRWRPATDTMEKVRNSVRLLNEIRLHTGMTDDEMQEDLKEKEKILHWMLENKVRSVNAVGKVVSEYYHDKERVMKIVNSNSSPEPILGKDIMKELKEAV